MYVATKNILSEDAYYFVQKITSHFSQSFNEKHAVFERINVKVLNISYMDCIFSYKKMAQKLH